MNNQPFTMEGQHVRLQPLVREHIDALWQAGNNPEVWRWTSSKIKCRGEMESYVESALSEADRGVSLPFVITERASGQIVGTTRFGNIAPEHRRVEIGWTFISPPFQRTAINTETKYLMLRHAFDVWRSNRVELKTSAANQKSRAAICRIGAREEGTLRSHMINDDGTVRDTVYYSIIAEEWPEVRERLESMLARNPAGSSHTHS